MSGLVGACCWNSAMPAEDELRRAAKRLARRGADDLKLHYSTPFAAVVSVFAAENHPGLVCDQSTGDALLVDGVLDNVDLSQDAADLLDGLRRNPQETLVGLRGDFALVHWSTGSDRRGRVLLARDRLGSKPLFYSSSPACTRFASAPSAVAALGHPAAVDVEAIYVLLRLGLMPAPWTGWEGISAVRPAQMVIIEDGIETRHVYWNLPYPGQPIDLKASKVARQIRSLVEKAVMERLPAGGDAVVTLSGGIDSTAVAGLVRTLTGQKIQTICLGFDGSPSEDLAFARHAAGLLESDHHEVFVGPQMLEEHFDRIVACLEVPSALSYAEHFLSDAIHALGFTTVITGEIADSLFGGFSLFAAFDRLRRYRLLPAGFRRRTAAWLRSSLPRNLSLLGKHPIHALDMVDRLDHEPLEGQYLILRALFGAPEAQCLLPDAGDSERALRLFLSDLVGRDAQDPRDSVFRLTMGHQVPSEYLRDEYKFSRPLLYRSPFMENDLVEFAMNLPAHRKTTSRTPKFVLVRAMSDLLPQDIIDRPKRGFTLPLGDWLRRDLRAFLDERLNPDSMPSCFDRTKVASVKNEFIANNDPSMVSQVWLLMTLAAWNEAFMTGGIANTLEGADAHHTA